MINTPKFILQFFFIIVFFSGCESSDKAMSAATSSLDESNEPEKQALVDQWSPLSMAVGDFKLSAKQTTGEDSAQLLDERSMERYAIGWNNFTLSHMAYLPLIRTRSVLDTPNLALINGLNSGSLRPGTTPRSSTICVSNGVETGLCQVDWDEAFDIDTEYVAEEIFQSNYIFDGSSHPTLSSPNAWGLRIGNPAWNTHTIISSSALPATGFIRGLLSDHASENIQRYLRSELNHEEAFYASGQLLNDLKITGSKFSSSESWLILDRQFSMNASQVQTLSTSWLDLYGVSLFPNTPRNRSERNYLLGQLNSFATSAPRFVSGLYDFDSKLRMLAGFSNDFNFSFDNKIKASPTEVYASTLDGSLAVWVDALEISGEHNIAETDHFIARSIDLGDDQYELTYLSLKSPERMNIVIKEGEVSFIYCFVCDGEDNYLTSVADLWLDASSIVFTPIDESFYLPRFSIDEWVDIEGFLKRALPSNHSDSEMALAPIFEQESIYMRDAIGKQTFSISEQGVELSSWTQLAFSAANSVPEPTSETSVLQPRNTGISANASLTFFNFQNPCVYPDLGVGIVFIAHKKTRYVLGASYLSAPSSSNNAVMNKMDVCTQ